MWIKPLDGETIYYSFINWQLSVLFSSEEYRCFLIYIWNKTDFQTQFSLILDLLSGIFRRQTFRTQLTLWYTLGLCNIRSQSRIMNSRIEFERRFWSKCRSANTCMIWTISHANIHVCPQPCGPLKPVVRRKVLLVWNES